MSPTRSTKRSLFKRMTRRISAARPAGDLNSNSGGAVIPTGLNRVTKNRWLPNFGRAATTLVRCCVAVAERLNKWRGVHEETRPRWEDEHYTVRERCKLGQKRPRSEDMDADSEDRANKRSRHLEPVADREVDIPLESVVPSLTDSEMSDNEDLPTQPLPWYSDLPLTINTISVWLSESGHKRSDPPILPSGDHIWWDWPGLSQPMLVNTFLPPTNVVNIVDTEMPDYEWDVVNDILDGRLKTLSLE